jgi:DNA-binding CsgD family transcriptional regulator
LSKAAARTGLVVVSNSFNVLAISDDALQILNFPAQARRGQRLDVRVQQKLRLWINNGSSENGSGSVHNFVSGRRLYLCRCLPINPTANQGTSSPAHVLLFERRPDPSLTTAEIYDRFGFTPRQQEAIELLLQGLTSKEIAAQMKISPFTVKSFLHLVMVKLGVSTRSGIVGKILGAVEPGQGNGVSDTHH